MDSKSWFEVALNFMLHLEGREEQQFLRSTGSYAIM
jgi:hypothetical protein